jgi:hypothetical protein
MALTDLTNTTWVFPNPPDMSNYPLKYNYVYIDFESNSAEFVRFYAGPSFIYYYKRGGGSRQVWSQYGGYPWDDYRTIHITGGTDATNATFIAWLEKHAILFVKPYRVYEPALVATADAIRAKGETSAPIEWTENGFAEAITNMVVPIPSDYGHIAWDGHTLTVS